MKRSIAEQKIDELGGRLSVLTRQRRDHAKPEDLEGATGAGQGRVLLRIYRLVFPHAFAEEAVLRPVMRAVLPAGHELTLEVEREQQEANELVTALEAMAPEDPARGPLPARLVAVLREGARDERTSCSRGCRRSWTGPGCVDGWRGRRSGAAPIRAHPVVARRPPDNVIAAVPLSVLDRVRDLVDAAVLRGPERAAPTLRPVSARPTRLAHRIEHLPVRRRGEDPSTASPGT